MRSDMLRRETGCFLKRLVWVMVAAWAFAGSSAAAQRFAVAGAVANIRSGPGTRYDILWKVARYHPLVVIEKSGAWYHFRDFEDDEGWIHKSLVDATPSVITSGEKCNVRSGPGTRFAVLFSVEKGIPFMVLKRRGAWIQVRHADGDRGWIHKSLVW